MKLAILSRNGKLYSTRRLVEAAREATDALLKLGTENPVDVLAGYRARRTQQALFARLGSRMYDSSMTEQELQSFVQQELGQVVDRRPVLAAVEVVRRQRLATDRAGVGRSARTPPWGSTAASSTSPPAATAAGLPRAPS